MVVLLNYVLSLMSYSSIMSWSYSDICYPVFPSHPTSWCLFFNSLEGFSHCRFIPPTLSFFHLPLLSLFIFNVPLGSHVQCDERRLQIWDMKKWFGMWERSCLYYRTGFSSSLWLCMLKGGNCVSPGCRCFDPVRLTFVQFHCCCLMHLPYRKGSAGSNMGLCCLLG